MSEVDTRPFLTVTNDDLFLVGSRPPLLGDAAPGGMLSGSNEDCGVGAPCLDDVLVPQPDDDISCAIVMFGVGLFFFPVAM